MKKNLRSTQFALVAILFLVTVSTDGSQARTNTQQPSSKSETEKHAQARKNETRSAPIKTNGKDALKKMYAKYKTAKTLTAEFHQVQRNLALGTEKKSSGRLFIKSPDMFRWQTVDPEPSILVSNGKKVWYYTPPFRKEEKGQVLVRRTAETQSKLAIDVLSGQSKLEKNFNIESLEPRKYRLVPLKPTADIEHIELHLESPTDLVYKLILFTKTGNQTELTLKGTTLGPRLPDTMFNFTPPPNTEEVQ
ncbi:MAG: outer membrane lipoprotein carrier protein LolA [Bdellovibrionota bacterium]